MDGGGLPALADRGRQAAWLVGGDREEAEQDVEEQDWREEWFADRIERVIPIPGEAKATPDQLTDNGKIARDAKDWKELHGRGKDWTDADAKDLYAYLKGKGAKAGQTRGGRGRGHTVVLRPHELSDVVRSY